MSILTCINRAVSSGLMDPRRAQMARDLFNENLKQSRLSLGGDEAVMKAQADMIQELSHALGQMKREKLLQITRAKGIMEEVKASGVDIGDAMLAVLSEDPRAKNVTSIETRYKTIRGMAHSRLNQFLERYRRDLLGKNRNAAELVELGREVFRENSGNKAARELAEAWTDTAEWLRKAFNQAGGDIPKRDRWGLPQSHDSIAVRAAGFDAWYQDIRAGVDISRMKDYRTGKPMTEFQFKEAARDAFDAISTEGWSRREATGTAYGQKLARRRMDHRFFEFKDFDSWNAYNEKYGSGDIFSIMLGHVDSMARDISALQVLGPNPMATTRWMGDVVEKELRERAAKSGARTDKIESQIRSTRRNIDLLWDAHTGALSSPVNGKVARSFAGVRSLLQSAQLGAAALSAVSDLGFQKMAAGHVGIPFGRIVKRYGTLLNPANAEDRLVAVRLGLIAEDWSSIAMGQQRYFGEVSGPEVSRRIVDAVMRVSGLSPWTQAGKWAFGMEFTGLLADNVGKAFNDLPKELRSTMERYGISSFDWDLARRTDLYEHKGASFLRPEDIAEEATALRFLDMLHGETEFAVPGTSRRGRVAIIGENRPGTFTGELIRSAAMYKNFSATLMFTHYRRLMSLPTPAERGKYFAQFFLMATAFGALSLQLKDVSKGRDPRKMIDFSDPAAMAKFWGAAALQGGGLGIFGDFLFAQQNRYGGGLAQTVAGPMVGAAADFTGYFNSNAQALISGKKTNVVGGAIDIAQRYMPGGSMWWARQGMESLIWDQLRRIGDPNFSQRVHALDRKRKTEYGQDSWWRRGDALPSRAPDLGAAFGGK